MNKFLCIFTTHRLKNESDSHSVMCHDYMRPHNPMDYTVHGILKARILELVAFFFSRGSSQPRDRAQVSCIADRFFTSWTTKEAQVKKYPNQFLLLHSRNFQEVISLSSINPTSPGIFLKNFLVICL